MLREVPMVPLQNVRMIVVQFSFSNPEVIPSGIKRRNRETAFEHVARKLQATGERVIEPTKNVFLGHLVGDFEGNGFELVDAFYQARPDHDDLKGTYHTVRFLFARHEFATPSAEFRMVRDAIRAELREMLRTAFWRVRAFLNPFYQNGEEIAGQRSLSINLEVRVSRFLPDGSPGGGRL